MSFEGLQDRLAALQETTLQLQELIDRLATLKFQPGSVPLATDEENSVSGELSAEITNTLRDGEEEQEILQEEVEFVRAPDHDRERLREGVEKIGKDLAGCRLSFRKARLAAKNSLTHAQRLERELLVQSFSQPASEATSPLDAGDEKTLGAPSRPQRHAYPPPQQQQSSLSQGDQQTVGASSNVTNALRQTHDLIAGELMRSEYAHETLNESSAALKQLNESYGSLDTLLASSRDLLGTLLRSQKSDTWYLQTALFLLLGTGAWLFFRRLLFGPLWWLVWLPLRMVFGAGTTVGGAVLRQAARGGAGESGKVEMGQEGGGVPVEGLPSDELPTAKVGEEAAADVLDEVDRIAQAVKEADELGAIPEHDDGTEAETAQNTKKRVWEEPEVADEGRQRDEL